MARPSLTAIGGDHWDVPGVPASTAVSRLLGGTMRESRAPRGERLRSQSPHRGPEVGLRTEQNARRRQMQQAMRSTGFGGGKDGFKKVSTARMQLAHQLRHMGFSASNDKALHEAVSDGFGLPQAAAWALANSSVAQRAFREALTKGTLRPRTLKAMFVGQGRAGKTSTLKALTGQQFQERERSTHGLSTALPLVNTEAGGSPLDLQSSLVSQWRLVERSEHEIHGAELEKRCAAYVAERLANKDLAPPGDEPEEVPEVTSSSKMRVDLVAKMIQGDEDEQSPVLLKTWDFGGQREYYVMHHLFLTNRGFYIVVTRLDAWLAPLDSELTVRDTDSEDGGAFEAPLDALTFWLSSIHVHAPDALVFIVGTHADVVAAHEETEARVEEEIVSLMEKVPGLERQVVVNSQAGKCFFPVDNRSGTGIAELREAIDREATVALAPNGHFAQELPLPWLRLREALEDAAEGSTGEENELPPFTATFVLSLAKVQQMGQEAGVAPESLIDCLKCLHDFGSIVFFDEDELRDHVVLNPQWLADAMAQVLNCPRVVQGHVAAAKRLRERGELEEDLLTRCLWRHHKFRENQAVLLRMLHRFDLLVPLTTRHTLPSNVVPSLLPSAPPQPTLPLTSDKIWNSLFFDFHGLLCRLLPTLFPKLVAASSRQDCVEGIGSLGLFRDSFRLLWMGDELTMDLLPAERPQVVRVTSQGGLSVAVVQGLLQLVKATLAQKSHLSFTAGVLCEHCHAQGRSLAERHHVLDLQELLQEAPVPCRFSARAVVPPETSWVVAWRSSTAATCPRLNLEDGSPAHTASTEVSVQSSRGGSMVNLLYASPIWRNEAGELPQLDVQNEVSLLELGEAMHLSLATASNLAAMLTAEATTRSILHLSLHCADNGQVLLLEDATGGAHAFSLEDLQALLKATSPGASRLQLVFLNACCSDLAGQIFLEAGAPHVVCCRGSVFDATAQAFTKAFYRAFAAGRSIASAFDLAKLEIRTAPQPGLRAEAEKYLLLPEGDASHQSCFCELAWHAGPRKRRWLPSRVEDFCGRSRDLWLLLKHLGSARRCVLVHGPAKIGKSALLTELARFAAAPGRSYENRVIYLACDEADLENREEPLLHFLQQLFRQLRIEDHAATQETFNMDLSAQSEVRILRSQIVQSLQELASLHHPVLLILDDLDSLLQSNAEELRKVLTELLLRTEGLELLLAAREAPFQALGAHKVVGYHLDPLQPLDAARLFLWRVHRPLVVADFSVLSGSEAEGPSRMLPLIMNAQNRGVLLQQLSGHPLLQWCGGCPGHLRAAADHVLPGSGTLWDIHEHVQSKAVAGEWKTVPVSFSMLQQS